MQEIVDEVLKAEEHATHFISEAKEKASQIKNSVESETSEIIKKAKEDAQHLILTEVANAKAQADIEYKETMSKVERDNRQFIEQNQKKFGSLVEKIIELAQKPEILQK
jgi:vacuolar-type H+-ATPase subunit H